MFSGTAWGWWGRKAGCYRSRLGGDREVTSALSDHLPRLSCHPTPKVIVLVGMDGWPSDQRVGDPLLDARGPSVTFDVRTHWALQRGIGPAEGILCSVGDGLVRTSTDAAVFTQVVSALAPLLRSGLCTPGTHWGSRTLSGLCRWTFQVQTALIKCQSCSPPEWSLWKHTFPELHTHWFSFLPWVQEQCT